MTPQANFLLGALVLLALAALVVVLWPHPS